MSAVVLIGAGGLGGPIAYALGAAGHRLAVIDDDAVELSNLQRQVQFVTADVGRRKASALTDELARRGVPRGRVTAVDARFTLASAPALLRGADLVVDGSDNLATKFAVNDACVAAGLAFVIAGVIRSSGQVLAVVPGETGCYRCVFEAPPADGDADSCASAGVLGAAVAVVAGHAAQAALALLAGDRRAAGALQVFDDLAAGAPPRRIAFRRRPGCAACGSRERAAAVEAM